MAKKSNARCEMQKKKNCQESGSSDASPAKNGAKKSTLPPMAAAPTSIMWWKGAAIAAVAILAMIT
jgi:hypothetical protein